MGSSRDYMREYMARKRRTANAHCACGKKAFKIVNGNEGVCKRCWQWETNREALCRRGKTAKKWSAPEVENRGALYWKEKLSSWLPNTEPGWGSLAILERRLGA